MATVRRGRVNKAGKRPWVLNYTDHNGRRVQESCRTKVEAEDRLYVVQGELRAGSHVPRHSSRTVNQACDAWLAQAELAGLERSTKTQYALHANRYIRPMLGNVKLGAISKSDVKEFADALLRNHSRVMSRKVLGSLKTVLRLAGRNVAQDVRITLPTRHKKQITIPKAAELNRLLAQPMAPGFCTLLNVLAFCGLRISEARGLRHEDIDSSKCTISVAQRADNYNKIGPCKAGASYRTVPVPPRTMSMLREWTAQCPAGDLVFPTKSGTIKSYGNIRTRHFVPAMTAAGLAGRFTIHCLRHYYASALIERGLSVRRVQALLGHADPVITLRTYSHLIDARDGDAAKQIAAMESDLRQDTTRGGEVVPMEAVSR